MALLYTNTSFGKEKNLHTAKICSRAVCYRHFKNNLPSGVFVLIVCQDSNLIEIHRQMSVSNALHFILTYHLDTIIGQTPALTSETP